MTVMRIDSPLQGFGEIPRINIPENFVPILRKFHDQIVDSMKGQEDKPIEDISLRFQTRNTKEKIVYLYFIWINSTNKCIDNMSLVLADLEMLGEHYFMFKGSPKTRFYLLIKTFFNEIYRMRDLLNQLLSALVKLKKMTKSELQFAREQFREIFDLSVSMRNNMVHGHPDWKGKEHSELDFVLSMLEIGCALLDKETGEIWNPQEVLKNITSVYRKHLREEGEMLHGFFTKFIESTNDLIIES